MQSSNSSNSTKHIKKLKALTKGLWTGWTNQVAIKRTINEYCGIKQSWTFYLMINSWKWIKEKSA